MSGYKLVVFLLASSRLFELEMVSAFVMPVQIDPSVSEDSNSVLFETLDYLAKYGYLSVDSWKITPTDTDILSAVENLQSFMAISPTGTVDQKTLDAVRTPRCGLQDPVSDMAGRGGDGALHTRYGERWNKTELTYRIFKFPPSAKKSHFRNAVKQACQLWADVTPLTFREVHRKASADIDIRFYSGFHNDEMPFDGPRGVVGHPVKVGDGNGDPHVVRLDLDADEAFTFDSPEGINLFQVMAHQLGHALGLGHSSDHASIMSPCTKPYKPNIGLSQTDINGVQAIYGSANDPSNSVESVGPRLPTAILHGGDIRYLCEEKPLDAVAILAGEIYVFKGNRYWQFRSRNDPVSPNSGSLIADRWPGLPSGLDAVYQRHTDNKAVFVKSGRMYIYDIHPKDATATTVSYTEISLRDLGLPRRVDAALVSPSWTRSSYFLKRGKVWHYNDQAETILAGPLQVQDLWEGLPSRRLDAAFTYQGNSYFVLDEGYWKVDHSTNRVGAGYPRNFHTDFLGC